MKKFEKQLYNIINEKYLGEEETPKISEKIIAASKPNLFIGCIVISEAIFGLYIIFINPFDKHTCE